MNHTTEILFSLFIIFISSQIGAEIAQRLKLPSVVGEILAGCIIGPSCFGLIHINEPLEVLAEIGVIFLLFSVGLETRLGDLWKVGKLAVLVGLAGSIVPFIFGTGWGVWAGFTTTKSLFIGAAFVATSVGITAKVLHELGVLQALESRVILGAAVVDDILAMLLLGVVTAIQGGQSVDVMSLTLVLMETVAFIAAVLFIGTRIMKKSSDLLEVPINPLSPLTLSVAGCLGLAFVSAYFGLAAIIGAFLAGVVMAETQQRKTLEHQVHIISTILVPFFFVVTGAKVELAQLASLQAIGMLGLATFLAVTSKLIGCGLGAASLGKRGALIVGSGMVPRGEVGIIVASLGLQASIFSNTTYAVIIGMSLITSIMAPPVLKFLFSSSAR